MKLAVFVSGSGTNLEAMLDFGIPVSLVLADRDCEALNIASTAGVATILLDRRHYSYSSGQKWLDEDRKEFTKAILGMLKRHEINLIAMAGFFSILHQEFFSHSRPHIINIHPALLPEYKGQFAVRDSLTASNKLTGSTIHIATEIVDDDRYIIAQTKVPILTNDTLETLWERIKTEERRIYPKILQSILSGDINLDAIVQRGNKSSFSDKISESL